MEKHSEHEKANSVDTNTSMDVELPSYARGESNVIYMGYHTRYDKSGRCFR
jgi:hypothetical protein